MIKQDPEADESPLQYIYQLNPILDADCSKEELIKLIRETVSLPQDQPASDDEYRSRFECATEYVKYDRIKSNWSELGRGIDQLIAGAQDKEITWSLIESNNNAIVETSPRLTKSPSVAERLAEIRLKSASKPAGKLFLEYKISINYR